MARVDYVFKTITYEAQAVDLAAAVHLPANTKSPKGIGEIIARDDGAAAQQPH